MTTSNANGTQLIDLIDLQCLLQFFGNYCGKWSLVQYGWPKWLSFFRRHLSMKINKDGNWASKIWGYLSAAFSHTKKLDTVIWCTHYNIRIFHWDLLLRIHAARLWKLFYWTKLEGSYFMKPFLLKFLHCIIHWILHGMAVQPDTGHTVRTKDNFLIRHNMFANSS